MANRAFIGTSGYVYRHWRGPFYPRQLPPHQWFQFYAEHFVTVELNNSFYRLPTTANFTAWRTAAPLGFRFAVKASRFITHMKKLKDPAAPLRLFLGRARALDGALGPVLFQLPRLFRADFARLDGFLAVLTRQRLVRGLRVALEVRHPSWLDATVFRRLEDAGVALCFTDWQEVPVVGPITADFVYVRRHGSGQRYGGSYPDSSLAQDARAVCGWLRDGRDVYVYFNNDRDGHAVRNALRLRQLVADEATAERSAVDVHHTDPPRRPTGVALLGEPLAEI
jgi:uncharacterized protein YecE (DUF72 family)